MAEDQVYPKITFKRTEVADDLGGVVEKMNYNFDQVAMFSDLVKPRKIEQGERGIPGATGIGLPGAKGERGSQIWYSGVSIPDGAPVSDPEHLTNDTVIDSVPKFMRVVEDGLGNKFYELQINLASILSTDYLINQYDYLTGSGTAIVTYVQRNYPGSPSPGNPGSENLTLVKRVNDNISEFYRLMVGTDRYLNDPTDISLYLANILPDAGINANDPSLPQYSQIGLKFRPDASSNLTVNTAYIKYHENSNKWTFSIINSGVGIYAENDTVQANNNTIYLRGRKTKFIGNTANISSANIDSNIEIDVDTTGDVEINGIGGNFGINSDAVLTLSASTEITISSVAVNVVGTELNVNSDELNVNSNNVNFDSVISMTEGSSFNVLDGAVVRKFLSRNGSNAILDVGNTTDQLSIYAGGSGAVFQSNIVVRTRIVTDTGSYLLEPSGTVAIVGDNAGSVRLRTAANDVIHRRAGVDYRIWDEFNMGAGSGLNADTVDTLHAAQFLRSDANDEFTGTLSYTPDTGTVISFDAVPFITRLTANGGAQIGADDAIIITSGEARALVPANVNAVTEDVHVGADNNIYLYTGLQAGDWSLRHTLQLLSNGIFQLDGYDIWHEGNMGAGTGLNADLVDSLHADQFIRSDTADTFTGILTFTQHLNHNTPTGTVLALGTKPLITRLTSGGAAGFGADEAIIIGSGEAVATIAANVGLTSEQAYVGSDNSVFLYSNLQSAVWANRHTAEFNTVGDLLIDNAKVWHQNNDGHGGGLDADLLDGQHGAFYRDASNLNAGTVPEARLTVASTTVVGVSRLANSTDHLGTSQALATTPYGIGYALQNRDYYRYYYELYGHTSPSTSNPSTPYNVRLYATRANVDGYVVPQIYTRSYFKGSYSLNRYMNLYTDGVACPYLYVNFGGEKIFYSEIIENHRYLENCKEYTMDIPIELCNDGVFDIILTEEKNEVSYLYDIYLINSEGNKIFSNDGDNIILHRGDEKRFIFNSVTDDYKLHVTGYYIPYEPDMTSSNTSEIEDEQELIKLLEESKQNNLTEDE